MLALLLSLLSVLSVPEDTVKKAFGGHPGAFVLIECASGETFQSDAAACSEKVAPCSTFKIWNTAIGVETGLISDPDALFWKWDGTKRTTMEAWNQDQTVRTAFTFSCVPAYQNLARSIGPERMQGWLDKIGYGNRDIAAGIDVFWLPEAGRKTLLISPSEQAAMVARLVTGKLPLSEKTRAILKSIMMVKSNEHGTLYGKTGTGENEQEHFNWAWYVGYVESAGKTYAFACLRKGPHLMGTDARAAVESILKAQGLL